MSRQLAKMIVPSINSGLSAKHRSCVLSTSLATLGFEITIAEISPSCRCIRGPYFCANSLRPRCGIFPATWSKFPKIGSFHGPGGRLDLLFCFDFETNWNMKTMTKSEDIIEKGDGDSIDR